MKKFLALALVIIILISFGGRGETEPEEPETPNVVGIWQCVSDYAYDHIYNKLYYYVYADGTGDAYFTQDKNTIYGKHYNLFVWRIEDAYFVKESNFMGTSITKYTIDGDKMYDKQNKLAFTKVSDDPTIDIEITAD